jgi:hypothetical protein
VATQLAASQEGLSSMELVLCAEGAVVTRGAAYNLHGCATQNPHSSEDLVSHVLVGIVHDSIIGPYVLWIFSVRRNSHIF